MAKIGLFYDTDTGNTRKVAKMISKRFDDGDIELKGANKLEVSDFDNYSALIIGSPTLGDGELPDNWAEFLPQLDGMDFTGKTVALFGLGDQVGYGQEFVDALGILFYKFDELGATIIGSWPTDGYEYDASQAEVDGKFVGLVLDQDNQSDMTEERLDEWLEEVKPALLAAAG